MKDCNKGCAPYSGGWIVPPFWSFTAFTPTVPKMYWQVRSQEQRILNLFELINKVICYADVLGENVNELYKMVEELRENLESPEFIEHCIELVQKWIDEHMPDIIGKAARIVYFGLTLEGNFVAYIPEGNAWDDVQFDTGANYDLDTYGRLMLYYRTDTDSTVWQSEAPQGDVTQLIADIADLRRRVHANEVTLYTPITEGESEETIAYVGQYEDIAELATTLDDLESRVTANENTLYTPIEED